MTQYEQELIKSAEHNHIWLNAFLCVRPTPHFLQAIGQEVLRRLSERENLIFPNQDSDIPEMREMGKLSPQLILRINKS